MTIIERLFDKGRISFESPRRSYAVVILDREAVGEQSKWGSRATSGLSPRPEVSWAGNQLTSSSRNGTDEPAR